jgi:hypothetical protein
VQEVASSILASPQQFFCCVLEANLKTREPEKKQKQKKKVLPGLEPGLQGSKPWVLTNYTIEPECLRHVENKKDIRAESRTRDLLRVRQT